MEQLSIYDFLETEAIYVGQRFKFTGYYITNHNILPRNSIWQCMHLEKRKCSYDIMLRRVSNNKILAPKAENIVVVDSRDLEKFIANNTVQVKA